MFIVLALIIWVVFSCAFWFNDYTWREWFIDIAKYFGYTPKYKTSYPIISLKTFKQMYAICPERWDLRWDYVKYAMKSYTNGGRVEYYGWEYFNFNPYDLKRYQKMMENQAKLKKELAKAEILEMVSKEWQKDIDRFIAINNKQLEEAKRENQRIIENIKNNKI